MYGVGKSLGGTQGEEGEKKEKRKTRKNKQAENRRREEASEWGKETSNCGFPPNQCTEKGLALAPKCNAGFFVLSKSDLHL